MTLDRMIRKAVVIPASGDDPSVGAEYLALYNSDGTPLIINDDVSALPALTADGMGWRREGGVLVAVPLVSQAELQALMPENWHTVGGAGEPNFQNSWINNGGAAEYPAQFYKDSMEVVHLRGLVRNGSLASVIFTLPVGYRPSKNTRFAIVSNNAFAYAYVNSSGGVILQAGSTSPSVDLSSINFRAN